MNLSDTIIFNVALGLISFAALFLTIILYARFVYVTERNWKASITDLLQTLLAQYVNTTPLLASEKIKIRIIRLCNSTEKKQILLSQIIELYDNFNGSVSEKAKDLYDELALYQLSLKKVKSNRWHKKVEGMVELSLMNYRDATNIILPLLNHRNPEVRRHARIATIELQKSKGLTHLTSLSTEMSEWTYLSILSILHRAPFKLTTTELNQLKIAEGENLRSLVSHLEKHSITY